MLRCELENQKNDLNETKQLLEEANKKIEALKLETDKSNTALEQLKDDEVERLKEINFCQREEIIQVFFTIFKELRHLIFDACFNPLSVMLK